MKKLFITCIIALTVTLTAKSQIFLGYTLDQMKAAIGPNEKLSIQQLEGQKMVELSFTDGPNEFVKRYFIDDSTGRVYQYVVEPLTTKAYNDFIKMCNQSYTNQGKNLWLAKSPALRVKVHIKKVGVSQLFYFVEA